MSNKTMLKYEGISELDGINYQNTVLLRDTGEETPEAILRTEANYNGETIFADEVRADADREAVEEVLKELQDYATEPNIGEFNPDSIPGTIEESDYNPPGDIQIPPTQSITFVNTIEGEPENHLKVDEEYTGGEEINIKWKKGAENHFSKLIGLEGLDNTHIGSNPLLEAINYKSLPEGAQKLARRLDIQPFIEEYGDAKSAVSELSGQEIEFDNEYVVMVRGGGNEDLITLTEPDPSELEAMIDAFNPRQVQYLHDGKVENYFEDQVNEIVEEFSKNYTTRKEERNLPEGSILSIINGEENLETVNEMIVSEERIEDAELSIKNALGDHK